MRVRATLSDGEGDGECEGLPLIEGVPDKEAVLLTELLCEGESV